MANNPGTMPSISHRITKRIKGARKHILDKFRLANLPSDTDKTHANQRRHTIPVAPLRAQAIPRRYEPIRLLGEGGNGQVHLCRDVKLRTLVAVKTVHHPPSLPVEAEVLQLLGNHANVVGFLAVIDHPSQDFYKQLIFEYCELGDLCDYANANLADPTPEPFMWHAFRQIASGLHYIHSLDTVHGDLKCENILVSRAAEGDAYPTLKIADFGTAEVNPPHEIPLGHFATMGFQAPESVERHGPEVDIWALGCIIHELAARCSPLVEVDKHQMDTEAWFHASGRIVPPGTQNALLYIRFCYYMYGQTPAPKRIDRAPESYSKLLNYYMKRTLDTNYRSRITAYELRRSLPVMEHLVDYLLHSAHESVLNAFDDGWGDDWEIMHVVTDSNVFNQIFRALAARANRERNTDLKILKISLLSIMSPADQAVARQYVD